MSLFLLQVLIVLITLSYTVSQNCLYINRE